MREKRFTLRLLRHPLRVGVLAIESATDPWVQQLLHLFGVALAMLVRKGVGFRTSPVVALCVASRACDGPVIGRARPS